MSGETTLGEAQVPIRATMDKLEGDLAQVRGKVTATLDKVMAPIQNLGKVVAGVSVAAVGAIGAIGGAIGKLAIDAAPVEGIQKAFDGLAESAGITGDEMLDALQRGSSGMVPARDLMLSFNKAAQLVSTDFATQLPNAMQYLSKVSAATGTDMNFMLDSLVTGVGRMSPMILDNLGIQTSLAEATARAADMFGVEADQLTDAQIQAGMMNDVMAKLEENTAAMPAVTDTAAGKLAQMKARFQDTKDAIGTAFLPVLTTLMDKLGELADRVLPPLMAIIETVSGIISTFFENMDAGMDPLTAAEEAFKQFLPPELAEGITQVADGIRDVINWVRELVAAAQPYIDQVGSWISENIELKDLLIALGIALASVVVPAVWALVSPILAVIAVGAALALLVAGIRQAWETDFLGIRTLVETTLATIKAWWSEHGERVIAVVTGFLEFVYEVVKRYLQFVYDYWSTILGAIWSVVQEILGWVKQFWSDHGDALIALFVWWKDQMSAIFDAFKLAFSGDWEAFGAKLREVWDETWNKIKEIGEKVWTAIQDFFTKTDWGSIGRSILEGIASGITAGLSFIRDAARNAAQAALDAAKGFLGIDSPSRAFEMQVGLPSVQGWAEGLANTRPIEQAARTLANLSLSSANAGLQDNSRTMTVYITPQQSMGSIYRDLALVEAML